MVKTSTETVQKVSVNELKLSSGLYAIKTSGEIRCTKMELVSNVSETVSASIIGD
jgi:hypothetical protein